MGILFNQLNPEETAVFFEENNRIVIMARSQIIIRIIFLISAITLGLAEFIFNPKAISTIVLSSLENKTVFYFSVSDDSKHAFVSM